jgi:hypothetical protein
VTRVTRKKNAKREILQRVVEEIRAMLSIFVRTRERGKRSIRTSSRTARQTTRAKEGERRRRPSALKEEEEEKEIRVKMLRMWERQNRGGRRTATSRSTTQPSNPRPETLDLTQLPALDLMVTLLRSKKSVSLTSPQLSKLRQALSKRRRNPIDPHLALLLLLPRHLPLSTSNKTNFAPRSSILPPSLPATSQTINLRTLDCKIQGLLRHPPQNLVLDLAIRLRTLPRLPPSTMKELNSTMPPLHDPRRQTARPLQLWKTPKKISVQLLSPLLPSFEVTEELLRILSVTDLRPLRLSKTIHIPPLIDILSSDHQQRRRRT